MLSAATYAADLSFQDADLSPKQLCKQSSANSLRAMLCVGLRLGLNRHCGALFLVRKLPIQLACGRSRNKQSIGSEGLFVQE